MNYSLIVKFVVSGLLFSSVALAQDSADGVSDETAVVDVDRSEKGNRGNRDRGDNNSRNNRDDDSRNNRNSSNNVIRAVDTDEDGQMSVDEYMAYAQQSFIDLDLDGNNFVTDEELAESRSNSSRRSRDSDSDSQ